MSVLNKRFFLLFAALGAFCAQLSGVEFHKWRTEEDCKKEKGKVVPNSFCIGMHYTDDICCLLTEEDAWQATFLTYKQMVPQVQQDVADITNKNIAAMRTSLDALTQKTENLLQKAAPTQEQDSQKAQNSTLVTVQETLDALNQKVEEISQKISKLQARFCGSDVFTE